MPRIFQLLLALTCFVVTTNLFAEETLHWTELPSLPDAEGFAGPFAGRHGQSLIVAGGANFPGKMPWEGGAKTWYDRAFVLDSLSGSWRQVGKLPRPIGYGVSISTAEGVICIGGSDAQQHYQECFRILWIDGKLGFVALPSLPKPCANACGALLGSRVYVAGGLESPTATTALRTFWRLDLADSKARWQELDPWPGPARMLAVAAVQSESFFLCSGASLSAGPDGKPIREYLKDAYRYRPEVGWERIADLPRAAVAAPSPAPALDGSKFLVISGDDGSLVDFQPLDQHPGFPKSVLAYDTNAEHWQNAGEVPRGHVTTTMVRWQDQFIMPTGEIRPGKRTPSVWSVRNSVNAGPR